MLLLWPQFTLSAENKNNKEVETSWISKEVQKVKEDTRAQEDKEVKEEAVTAVVGKEITGEVGGVSKDYIGVMYRGEKDMDYEMGIHIEGDPELDHVQDLTQIQVGDTVTVKYDEVSKVGEDGKAVTQHVAKKIIFVKKALPPAPEKNELISDEGGQ